MNDTSKPNARPPVAPEPGGALTGSGWIEAVPIAVVTIAGATAVGKTLIEQRAETRRTVIRETAETERERIRQQPPTTE
jgi:hypothetical protein